MKAWNNDIDTLLHGIVAESDVFIDVSLGYIKEKVARAMTKEGRDRTLTLKSRTILVRKVHLRKFK